MKTSDVDDVGGSGCALNGTSRSKTKEGKRWKDFVLGVCSVQTSMDEALMGRLCRAPCPMDQRIAARSEAPVVKAAVQGRTSELSMPASQVTTWGTIARDVALLHNACHITTCAGERGCHTYFWHVFSSALAFYSRAFSEDTKFG